MGGRASNLLLKEGAGDSGEEMEGAREVSEETIPEEIPLQSGRAGEATRRMEMGAQPGLVNKNEGGGEI